MHLFPILLLLFSLTSTNTLAQESGSFSLFNKLQELGINLGQKNTQELLPPDEAFKISLEVRDAETLIAKFIPAKDYYLYRDKIAFEPQETEAFIEKVTLPKGKMKEDLTFGYVEVYYEPFQAIISLKRKAATTEQPLKLAATYQGCNEPIGVCYA
ncbi:MAG TPA: thiol:disulfide interchange protein, partial [Nitrosomonas sp.]|nr:thiol:disulfide interchange protein [Nitrosomonas sp.]